MKISCDVIRDLLALYAEEMVSQDTKTLIEDHCAACESCKKALNDMKMIPPMPIDNDTSAIKRIKMGIRKRRSLTALSVILIAVTLAVSLFVWFTTPIWLSAEDAIEYVEQLDDGRLKIKYSDKCSGRLGGTGTILCYKTRGDLLHYKKLPEGMNDASYGGYDVVPAEESLWYLGEFAGEKMTLLWGNEQVMPSIGDGLTPDRTLEYIFRISLPVGTLLMLLGILLWKKRTGKILLHCALPFLCCSISCLFVTWGYFLALEDFAWKFACTVTLTVLTCGSVMCCWKLFTYHRKDRA